MPTLRPVNANLPDSPYNLLGGKEPVIALAQRFYDEMEEHEPALTATHRCTPEGKVSKESRDNFASFLVFWLGGPHDYLETQGHPRLRMRHAPVAIDSEMRDAWLRSMHRAMDAQGVEGPVRDFLDARFAHVANFLRNRPDSGETPAG